MNTSITLNAIDRGWFAETGAHSAQQQNTATGLAGNLGNLRAFLVFDLATIKAPVERATIRLELDAYLSSGASETFLVSSVRIPARAMGISYQPGAAAGRTIYEELGTGTVYARKTVSASDVGCILEIDLSPQAVLDIQKTSRGLFAVGLQLADVDLSMNTMLRMLRFSSATEERTHQLVLEVEVPSEARPVDNGEFGLHYDIPDADVSKALREVVAKQAETLEAMLKGLLNAVVHVKEQQKLEEDEKMLYLNQLIEQTTEQLGGFADNHVHVEQRIGEVLAGKTSVTLSPNCLNLLNDLEQVNTVLHTNVAVARRYLNMMREEFNDVEIDDDGFSDFDAFDD